jgi:hypothetical protein
MDEHDANRREELSELEGRLAGWRPGTEGLNADALLYSAGLACAQSRRKRVRRLLTGGFLVALAAGLGAWGWTEHAERQALASLLQRGTPEPRPQTGDVEQSVAAMYAWAEAQRVADGAEPTTFRWPLPQTPPSSLTNAIPPELLD